MGEKNKLIFLRNVLVIANVLELASRSAYGIDSNDMRIDDDTSLAKSTISSAVYNTFNKKIKRGEI